MTTYYIDANAGNDGNDGHAANAAFKTLAKVQSLLEPNDVVLLSRGAVWHEDLYVTDANITIKGYGDGANPQIHGDNGSRAGILIAAPNAVIEQVDVTSTSNGIYITGNIASATVLGGTFWQNGSGIVAGGGGRLILADGITSTGNVRAFGAGDGIQISQDASADLHQIRNANLSNNENSGINAKVGTVEVSRSTLAYNGEPGWIAQNDIQVFRIADSVIKGNNRSDNGTGQASIEDRATVYSTGNVYENPNNGYKATVQINMISTNGSLFSVDDVFLNNESQSNTLGSIRVNTGSNPAVVSVVHGTFEHAGGSGIAIDGYGVSYLKLRVEDSSFDMTNTAAIRLHPGSTDAAHIDRNNYSRDDGGTVIEIQDSVYFSTNDFALLSSEFGFEANQPVGTAVEADVPTGLMLRPLASTDPGETHAALVVSRESFSGQYSFAAAVQTSDQLRETTPANPWETAWLVWGYQDNQHFYYFTLKTNGWELGKVDPAYPGAQRFLATGDSQKLEIGAWHDFQIEVNGASFTVKIDGTVITTFTDQQGPLYTSGKIGFYTEDAEIRVDNVTGPIVDDFEGYANQTFPDGSTFGPWQSVFNGYGSVEVIDLPSDLAVSKQAVVLHAPSDILLSNSSIAENLVGEVIGRIEAADADGDGNFTFAVSDSRFTVVRDDDVYELKLVAGVSLDYEAAAYVPLSITVQDSSGLSFTKQFELSVIDVAGVTIKGTSGGDIIDGSHTVPRNEFPSMEGDTIYGNGGDDTVHGLAGNDIIHGNGGNDRLFGDGGDDYLVGGTGIDTVDGGEGNDTIVIAGTGDKSDSFNGGSGIDTMLVSGTGVTTLNGFNAAVSSIEIWQGKGQGLAGGSGNNTFDFSGLTSITGLAFVDGGKGNDRMIGSIGADDLRGGAGSDVLDGRAGNDILTGGIGSDAFVFGPGFARDTITDFAAGPKGGDTIELSRVYFQDYDQVREASQQVGADVVITAGPNESITLKNVTLAQLNHDDFRFF